MIPFGLTGFVCFAYGDIICLRLGLYKKFSKYSNDLTDSKDEWQFMQRERQNSEWDQDFVYDQDAGGAVASSKRPHSSDISQNSN